MSSALPNPPPPQGGRGDNKAAHVAPADADDGPRIKTLMDMCFDDGLFPETNVNVGVTEVIDGVEYLTLSDEFDQATVNWLKARTMIVIFDEPATTLSISQREQLIRVYEDAWYLAPMVNPSQKRKNTRRGAKRNILCGKVGKNSRMSIQNSMIRCRKGEEQGDKVVGEEEGKRERVDRLEEKGEEEEIIGVMDRREGEEGKWEVEAGKAYRGRAQEAGEELEGWVEVMEEEVGVVKTLTGEEGDLREREDTKEEADLAEDTKTMAEYATAYFSDILTSRRPSDESLEQLRGEHDLWQFTDKRLAPHQCRSLDRPLTLEELKEAAGCMAKGKAPGDDGLPVEFFMATWDTVGPILVCLFNRVLEGKLLTEDMNRGVITLLYKKGDKKNVRNWRPISLLNVAYKILDKALVRRLASLLPELVKADQGAFVKGISIAENMLTTMGALEIIDLVVVCWSVPNPTWMVSAEWLFPYARPHSVFGSGSPSLRSGRNVGTPCTECGANGAPLPSTE
ncbi:hypothetical protein CBR_g48713 [Chara braunii]|uniref:Uncharacterized protein n=1 Tax=Chara braunii TaxID=69332 RepID=A0A388K4I4_CHABU|nr:hypothetical protein CBR_g48713 [Chara braunii]|eukprot:GBG64964.1 hypothetical protein CBR_g48713 [Chara braunii]